MTPNNAAFAPRDSSPPPRGSCATTPMRPWTKSARPWVATSAAAAPMPACCWSRQNSLRRKEAFNMAKVNWPPPEKRVLLGKRIDRADGPAKTTGAAKYSYDINRPGMLWAKLVTSPHPKAEVTRIDTSAAEALAGVKGVWKDDKLTEVQYVGHIVAAVAAETEEIATEAARLVKVDYKPLEAVVKDTDPALAKGNPETKEKGQETLPMADAMAKADVVHSGIYGCP